MKIEEADRITAIVPYSDIPEWRVTLNERRWKILAKPHDECGFMRAIFGKAGAVLQCRPAANRGRWHKAPRQKVTLA